MTPIRLAGLEGTNPLGFFAALGLLDIADRHGGDLRLRWTDEPIPRAELLTDLTIDEIVELVLSDLEGWASAPVLAMFDDINLEPSDNRRFIEACTNADDGGRSRRLVAALVAEGTALDGNGSCKPTDLHFTAGQQRFMAAAREIRGVVGTEALRSALIERWHYDSQAKSLMWDVADDRVYALSAGDPSKDAKLTVPGAEWLALLGLASFPCFADSDRTRTTGAGGSWKAGTFTWPLWSGACDRHVASSLVAHATLLSTDPRWAAQLSVTRILRSSVRRSAQGGYGSFGPPSSIV
ncbi:MAG: hypothetical protein R2770_07140 [Acidimicrobiales bacterium]